MKKLLFVLCIALLSANDIAIDMHLSKTKAYQSEAVVLDVNISQIDHSKVMLFRFSPKKSPKYQFYQVDFQEDNRHRNLKHRYKYLIYPTSSGSVDIEFDTVQSITDEGKIAYAISGDRDNVKALKTQDIIHEVAPLRIDVTALPKGVKLVGDYRLEYKIEKTTLNAFEPIHIRIGIKGNGLPLEAFDTIEESPSYKRFKQKPLIKNHHLHDSTQSSIEWRYALSASQSFTLEAIEMQAFDPKTHKHYTLTVPQTPFTIHPISPDKLLDKVDYPPKAQPFDWGWLWLTVSYIGVFVAGFLMPRDILKRLQKEVTTPSKLELEIAQTQTPKELLALLLAQNDRRLDALIGQWNQLQTSTLKELQKRALEAIT
ncbi:MAG: hypothetical protein KU38_05080 [Sulfurovum sp. FS08-3]|nr:MAG: hypothetical protein KU38_05080 [Sulfurovum sp. FS08-3]